MADDSPRLQRGVLTVSRVIGDEVHTMLYIDVTHCHILSVEFITAEHFEKCFSLQTFFMERSVFQFCYDKPKTLYLH